MSSLIGSNALYLLHFAALLVQVDCWRVVLLCRWAKIGKDHVLLPCISSDTASLSVPFILSCHCSLSTSGLIWCSQGSIGMQMLWNPWWRQWFYIWHHCLQCSVLTEVLFHHINCCIGHGALLSPDDWKLAVVFSNPEVVGRFKPKEVSSCFLPRPLWNLIWHQNLSLLAPREGLAHLAALCCL